MYAKTLTRAVGHGGERATLPKGQAGLALGKAVQITLANALNLIGVTAPEKM